MQLYAALCSSMRVGREISGSKCLDDAAVRRVYLYPRGPGSLLVLLLCLAVAAMLLEKKPAYYAEEARAWILRRGVVVCTERHYDVGYSI